VTGCDNNIGACTFLPYDWDSLSLPLSEEQAEKKSAVNAKRNTKKRRLINKILHTLNFIIEQNAFTLSRMGAESFEPIGAA
jgi:hypothetical protein